MHLGPDAQGYAAQLQGHAAAEEHRSGREGNATASASSEACGLDLGPLGNFLLGRCVCADQLVATWRNALHHD